MKKATLLFIVLLACGLTASAQQKPKGNGRPVTQKQQPAPEVKASPTAEGQRSQQRAQEDIRRSRAEKRAKMEQAKRDIRDKIATDTLPKR